MEIKFENHMSYDLRIDDVSNQNITIFYYFRILKLKELERKMGSEEEMMKVAMRAAKQNYLKEEIFEAGYDTDKFVLFVSGE